MNALKLSELTWFRRGGWPNEVKMGCCLFLSCSVFFILYFILISESVIEYTQSIQKIAFLKNDYLKKYNQAEHLETYKNQLAELKMRFRESVEALSNKTEIPSLLEAITKTGLSSGLSFELFAPSKESPHPFYSELPVNIIVVGTYQQVTHFMRRMEKFNRLMTVDDFTFSAAPLDKENSTPQEPTQERLIMKMTMTIYRYR